ncbi:uncharacterized protein LOC124118151 [Haliotis rufescens]|uniref:uncharacterized protein LOC124118151 n=1 Tax=Haliotis rufescens TaxID=6454 RepID=UPI001EB088F7|nr:uncharacterized protein LOC124118151 [Haliotis rufescens]
MTKMLMLSILVAIFFSACMCDSTGQNECTVERLEPTIEATTCGGCTTIRYTNGTLIEIQFFTNETMTVAQVGDDTNSCYVQRLTLMPEGIDYAETTLTEVAEDADEDKSAAIQALVPECQGRNIKILEEATEEPNTRRKKRRCFYYLRCTQVFRLGLGWFSYCRYVYICRPFWG